MEHIILVLASAFPVIKKKSATNTFEQCNIWIMMGAFIILLLCIINGSFLTAQYSGTPEDVRPLKGYLVLVENMGVKCPTCG